MGLLTDEAKDNYELLIDFLGQIERWLFLRDLWAIRVDLERIEDENIESLAKELIVTSFEKSIRILRLAVIGDIEEGHNVLDLKEEALLRLSLISESLFSNRDSKYWLGNKKNYGKTISEAIGIAELKKLFMSRKRLLLAYSCLAIRNLMAHSISIGEQLSEHLLILMALNLYQFLCSRNQELDLNALSVKYSSYNDRIQTNVPIKELETDIVKEEEKSIKSYKSKWTIIQKSALLLINEIEKEQTMNAKVHRSVLNAVIQHIMDK